MKYLLTTDIETIITDSSKGKNNVIGVQSFKRDKTDLEDMNLFDLQRWYIEEYKSLQLYDDDISERDKLKKLYQYIKNNANLRNRDMLEKAYLENGERSVAIGVEKVPYDMFNALRYSYNEYVSIIEMSRQSAGLLGFTLTNKEELDKGGDFYISNELRTLFDLEKSGVQYEIR